MIRIYQHGDHGAIAKIFGRSIHEIASEVYSLEQCLAWSDPEPNPEHWKKRCEWKRPFVFVVAANIAGFLELDTDGRIDCAYVHPQLKRRGIMTALVNHAIKTSFDMGQGRIFVEASLCIKPLLEKLGFTVVRDQLVTVRGVELQNCLMELLNPSQP